MDSNHNRRQRPSSKKSLSRPSITYYCEESIKQPRGDCDVERSFIPHSNLMKSTEPHSMRRTQKEARVFTQWNKQPFTSSIFRVYKI